MRRIVAIVALVLLTGCSPALVRLHFYDSPYDGRDSGEAVARPVDPDGGGEWFRPMMQCWRFNTWSQQWITAWRYGPSININNIPPAYRRSDGSAVSYVYAAPGDAQCIPSTLRMQRW